MSYGTLDDSVAEAADFGRGPAFGGHRRIQAGDAAIVYNHWPRRGASIYSLYSDFHSVAPPDARLCLERCDCDLFFARHSPFVDRLIGNQLFLRGDGPFIDQ